MRARELPALRNNDARIRRSRRRISDALTTTRKRDRIVACRRDAARPWPSVAVTPASSRGNCDASAAGSFVTNDELVRMSS